MTARQTQRQGDGRDDHSRPLGRLCERPGHHLAMTVCPESNGETAGRRKTLRRKMAQHLVLLLVNDDLGDIDSKEKLDDFVFELRQSTHADTQARTFYDLDANFDEDTMDAIGDFIAEMFEALEEDEDLLDENES